MNPQERPAEWVTSVASALVAIVAFYGDRDYVALAAAVGVFLPPIVTAIAARVPALAALRPTEAVTLVVSAIVAAVMWGENRDTAALVSALVAVLPLLITIVVELTRRRTVTLTEAEPRG